jgi:hypothetical protein
MRLLARGLASVFAVALLLSPLAAQVTESGSSALNALNQTESIALSGSMDSSVGGAVGWPSNPIASHFANTDKVIGLSLTNTLSFDARPSSPFRVHGTFETDYPGYGATPPTAFTVDELFLDYSINDAVFTRIGKQSIGWSNGRVFETGTNINIIGSTTVYMVGDLMANPVWDTSTAKRTIAEIAGKAYWPFGANGLTLVALAPSITNIDSSTMPSFAGRFDVAVGKFEFSEEANRLGDGTLDYSSAAKTSVHGVDLFAQVFGTIGKWSEEPTTVSGLAGAYWEITDPRVKAYCEYWHAGDQGYANDNRFALGLGWTVDESAGIKLGILWVHAFTDSSGCFMPTFAYTPWSKVTISAGILATYGDVDSIYASKLPPGYTTSFEWYEKYSLILKAEIALDY